MTFKNVPAFPQHRSHCQCHYHCHYHHHYHHYHYHHHHHYTTPNHTTTTMATTTMMIRCFYSLCFRTKVPVGSVNLSGRIYRRKDVASLSGYIDVITRTTFHLQDGMDAEVKVRNISPLNRKPSAAGSTYRTEDLGVTCRHSQPLSYSGFPSGFHYHYHVHWQAAPPLPPQRS